MLSWLVFKNKSRPYYLFFAEGAWKRMMREEKSQEGYNLYARLAGWHVHVEENLH